MTTNQKIAELREAMKKSGVSAYIIPSSDPHMSEYVAEHWKSRAYFSGFTGSAGTLVVTEEESGLWTDGRYFIQADKQLANSEIKLFKMGEKNVPTVTDYAVQSLEIGQVLGIDGRLFSASMVKDLKKKCEDKGISINTALDLVQGLWPNRPETPATEVFLHETKYAGMSVVEKLQTVRQVLEDKRVDAYVLTQLDSIAWLFNIRANDIIYNPMATAYAVVLMDKAYLCINQSRVPKIAIDELLGQGVEVRDYEEIQGLLAQLKGEIKILCHIQSMNYSLYHILEDNKEIEIKEDEDVVTNLKGVKNQVEIENIKEAHIKDGVALVQFKVKLEELMARGEAVTEYSILDMLREARAQQDNNMGESFGSIVGYKENAAMMHYAPTAEQHKVIKPEGFLLIDSGGQYLEGTTDITRTFAMGPVTEEEKLHYTLVLKSHINLARAIFLDGCTGGNLDILARGPIWEYGLDYKCGTGHGVGFFLGVHEGPQSLRVTNHIAFKEGMTITNEPGIYEEGKHGIRTENIMLVKAHQTTEYGKYLEFEPITYFPIDLTPIKKELLEAKEIEWLNNYHKMVYKLLSPRLEGKELKWLKVNTREL